MHKTAFPANGPRPNRARAPLKRKKNREDIIIVVWLFGGRVGAWIVVFTIYDITTCNGTDGQMISEPSKWVGELRRLYFALVVPSERTDDILH